jgi:CheY-like chemotaxis protein
LKQGGNERIMVIDDEPPVARVLQSMLQRVGYNVTIFNDSITAVKRFRMDPNCCDLVITDMLMPDMTGVELAREFLGQRSDIPIIILSGHSENVDRKRVKQLGIKELLLKPIKKEKLYQIIRRILEHGKNFDHR